MKHWFTAKDRKGSYGKEYKAEKSLQYLLKDLSEELGDANGQVDRVIDLFLPMETEHAEVVATIYAAWNDLLLDRKNPTDQEIVAEARENWTEEKLKIEKEKFAKSIDWLRRNNLTPKGAGKPTVRI